MSQAISSPICLQLQSSTFASSSFGFLSNMSNMSNHVKSKNTNPIQLSEEVSCLINLSWKMFKQTPFLIPGVHNVHTLHRLGVLRTCWTRRSQSKVTETHLQFRKASQFGITLSQRSIICMYYIIAIYIYILCIILYIIVNANMRAADLFPRRHPRPNWATTSNAVRLSVATPHRQAKRDFSQDLTPIHIGQNFCWLKSTEVSLTPG